VKWLLDKTGYIGSEQLSAEPNGVNTDIEYPTWKNSKMPVHRRVYRPEGYNRALVYRTEKGNPFIDSKGAGTNRPLQGSHSNGLATTAEALREFVFQKKVQQIFDHAELDERTVGCYAVVDWGFDVINEDGSHSPAGYVLRQAHTRYPIGRMGNTFVPRDRALHIESVLRRYGVTSSGEISEKLGSGKDIVNIQGNAKGEIVDFGAYLVRDKFQNPAYGYVDKFETPMFEPGKPGWVEPDPALRLPFDKWGYSITGKADPAADNISSRAHDLVKDLRAGKADRGSVLGFYREMMDSAPLPSKSCVGRFLGIISE
jgi:hypothetical protein